jgi:hypothetical protein
VREKKRTEGKNRRNPDADENPVQPAVRIIASIEIDSYAEQETCEGSEQERSFEYYFRLHGLKVTL